MTGHAIEARVYAEDPAAGFVPTEALSCRQVSAVARASGSTRGSPTAPCRRQLDPMLAKVIAHADTRDVALTRLDGAWRTPRCSASARTSTSSASCSRTTTCVPDDSTPHFSTASRDLHTHSRSRRCVIALAAVDAADRWLVSDDPWSRPDGWRLNGQPAAQTVRLGVGDTVRTVTRAVNRGHCPSASTAIDHRATVGAVSASHAQVTVDARRREYALATDGTVTWVSRLAAAGRFTASTRNAANGRASQPATPTSAVPCRGA